MVIDTNSAGVVAANTLTTGLISSAKTSPEIPIPTDDVTLSSRNSEETFANEVPEISDATEAWRSIDFARSFILGEPSRALRVQANLNPQNVLELLAE